MRSLFILFLLIGVPGIVVEVRGDDRSRSQDESSEQDDDGNYLYHHEDTTDVIHDYEPPVPAKQQNDKKHNEESKEVQDRPAFLYQSQGQPYRVVEFYAPWCPHCQHFHDHYVRFARQVQMQSNHRVQVYAVSCTVHRSICEDFEINSYPKIIALPENSLNYTKYAYFELHPFQVLKDFGLEFDQKFDIDAGEPETSSHSHFKKKNVTAIRQTSKKDIFSDAYRSFDYSLRHGVFVTNGPLPNATQNALREWLQLMKVSLPPTWKVQSVLASLLNDMESITTSHSQLLRVLDQHDPPNKKWSESCKKGNKAGGYTCGLWELFHIMTVGVVEWNLVSSSTKTIQGLDHAAQTLRNFIFHFFGCDVCRHNFVTSFDNCARDRCHRLRDKMYERKEWIDLPVWLWETHNAVNLRLLHERAEREGFTVTPEDERKSQWPQKEDCPLCWREDGAWEPDHVYKYLRLHYWIEDDIASMYRRELTVDEEDTDEGDSSSFFTFRRLVAIFVAGGLFSVWYAKQTHRRQTGKHKRDT